MLQLRSARSSLYPGAPPVVESSRAVPRDALDVLDARFNEVDRCCILLESPSPASLGNDLSELT
eukprot:768162-Hanusia_phi.AAC.2